jgi:CHAT domain
MTMLRQGAALEIRIRVGERSSSVLVKNGTAQIEGRGNVSGIKLGEMRKQVRQDLETFCNTFSRLEQSDPATVADGLRGLKARGRFILSDLFHHNPEDLPGLQALSQRACPTAGEWLADPGQPIPRLIEAHMGFGDGIPVETLPLFEYVDRKGPVNTWDDVELIVKSLPGFVGVVKRRLGHDEPRLGEFENVPLPVKVFLNRHTPGFGEVERLFGDKKRFLSQVWPDAGAPSDGERFVRGLACYLWAPEKDFPGQTPQPRAEIYHFHCHCETFGPPSGKYALILHTGRWVGGERRVELGSLRDALYQLRFMVPKAEGPRPLVFLNACGSTHVDPTEATSFPELFLEKGLDFLGVIGTEATIPEYFAREFAKRFYHRLFQGDNLGEALLASRWQMLRQFHNPLGILYTLYADPEVRIRPSVEDAGRRSSA